MKKINLLLITLAIFSGLTATAIASTCPSPDTVKWDGSAWTAMVNADGSQQVWTQATSIGSNNARKALYNQHHANHNRALDFVSAAAQSSGKTYNNLICGYAEQDTNNSGSHNLGDIQIALQPPQDLYSSINNLPFGSGWNPTWVKTATAVQYGKITKAQADDLLGRDWVCGKSLSACSFSDASVSIQPVSN